MVASLHTRRRVTDIINYIPEQFTVKAHPALFEGRGGRGGWGRKSEEHFIPVYIHIQNPNFKVEYLKNGTR